MRLKIALLLAFGPAVVSAIPQRGNFVGMAQCSSLQGIALMTVEVCERVCGTGWHPYEKWEVISAIATWVIPLFVLVGNMHFSNFALELFSLSPSSNPGVADTVWSVFLNYNFVALHLLGNPIDVIWSHLGKLDLMRQTRKWLQNETGSDEQGGGNSSGEESTTPLQQQDSDERGDEEQAGSSGKTQEHVLSEDEMLQEITLRPEDSAALTIILTALDDFNFNLVPNSSQKLSTILIRHIHGLNHSKRAAFLAKCRYAAFLLAHTRTSSTRRATLAVIAYTVALYTALASAMAQNAAAVHTPHTLALRELYYWLITAIALSSATGAFPTEHTARAALHRVTSAVGEDFKLAPLKPLTGGSYGYRPQKRISVRSLPLLGISFLAVGGAWAFSFVMSWITPTRGLGCRSFMELGFFAGWILNFLFSHCITRAAHSRWPGGAFAAMFVCDTIVAVPSVLCLFLAFKGWFNSCRCWAAVWTLPRAAVHYVPMDLAAKERALAPTYYALVASALGLQAVLSATVLVYYRRELWLIYGGSKDRSAVGDGWDDREAPEDSNMAQGAGDEERSMPTAVSVGEWSEEGDVGVRQEDGEREQPGTYQMQDLRTCVNRVQ